MIADPIQEILRQTVRSMHAAADSYEPNPRASHLEADYEDWLRYLFPKAYSNYRGEYVGLSEAHHAFWRHVWSQSKQKPAVPVAMFLPRGGGKSTNAEMLPISQGARGLCRYCLYVSGRQEQADNHVGSIMSRLESPRLAEMYPLMGERRLNQYGTSRGWKRNRLSTASGLTIDAIGLDVLTRGAKIDDDRPDLIIFDDVDAKTDSLNAVLKKIEILTHTILPAAAGWCMVAFVQNIIHYQSIAARLAGIATDKADFLYGRLNIGPYPALKGFTWDEDDEGQPVILTGEPIWPGQGLEECQALINLIGIRAFRAEAQHDDVQFGGGLFDKVRFKHVEPDDVPDLDRVEVWVDPAVSDTDLSDAHGVQASGREGDKHGTVYTLYSWEQRASPEVALAKAFEVALRLRASAIGVETDQGGDLWLKTYKTVWDELRDEGTLAEWCVDYDLDYETLRRPPFKWAKAGSVGSKAHRAGLMLTDYENSRIKHVVGPTVHTLENGLRRFLARKPYDLADAAFWAWYSLRGNKVNDEKAVVPGPLGQAVVRKSDWMNARADPDRRRETPPGATPPTKEERDRRRKLGAILGNGRPALP